MTGEIAAAGDIVAGALTARAVEPHAGEARAHEGHGTLCLNCGTRLIGEHCHRCGQSGHVHRTVGAIGHELAHGVFHFEGKIWRTLPMLAFRPGELTRRYAAGERARFVSPLALFLFSVFLMFAVYGFIGPGDLAELADRRTGRVEAGLAEARARDLSVLDRLLQERARLAAAGQPTARLDQAIAAKRADVRVADKVSQGLADPSKGFETGSDWLDRSIAYARRNPSLVAYKVQSSAYKYSWALILMSLPFVALLFLWRRGFTMYDHAVFVTYSITFMSLLVVAGELWLLAGLSGVGLLLLLPPVHMYRQLRGAYSLSRFSALWRTMLLVAFAGATLLMFVLGLVAMTISH